MKSLTVVLLVSTVVITGCATETYGNKVHDSVNVRVCQVEKVPVEIQTEYFGTVEAVESMTLSFSSSGMLTDINVKEGSVVKKGQLIGVIDDLSLKNAYSISAAARNQAEDMYARMKLLYEKGSLSEMKWVEVQSKVEQARAQEQIAKKALDDTRLYAPVSGMVAARHVDEGQNMMPGMPVVNLVRTNQVKVFFSVPEKEISDIDLGRKVSISIPAAGGRIYEGAVSEKGVAADPLTRSYPVRVLIDNEDGSLLPGMLADVSLCGESETAVLLPVSVIQIDSSNNTFVWTVRDGRAEKRYVTTGFNVADKVSVSSGLAEGDAVIVAGQQKVSEGMKVKAI